MTLPDGFSLSDICNNINCMSVSQMNDYRFDFMFFCLIMFYNILHLFANAYVVMSGHSVFLANHNKGHAYATMLRPSVIC